MTLTSSPATTHAAAAASFDALAPLRLLADLRLTSGAEFPGLQLQLGEIWAR
jgi:hypothetical protein